MRVGAGLGIVAGPGGSVLGAVAGAMLAALAGAAAGCAAGAALGEFLDDKLLNNHQCLDCGHCFGSPPTKANGAQPPRSSTGAHGREPFPTDSGWGDFGEGEQGSFPHRDPRD